jgi:hypothetical protein
MEEAAGPQEESADGEGDVMSPEAAAALARWLGGIRGQAPGLTLAALEAFLWVASGADSVDAVHQEMSVASPLARETVGRSMGLLRGRAQWRRDHWVTPWEWLVGRPHPHIRRAVAYVVSRQGQAVLSKLSTCVLWP